MNLSLVGKSSEDDGVVCVKKKVNDKISWLMRIIQISYATAFQYTFKLLVSEILFTVSVSLCFYVQTFLLFFYQN